MRIGFSSMVAATLAGVAVVSPESLGLLVGVIIAKVYIVSGLGCRGDFTETEGDEWDCGYAGSLMLLGDILLQDVEVCLHLSGE